MVDEDVKSKVKLEAQDERDIDYETDSGVTVKLEDEDAKPAFSLPSSLSSAPSPFFRVKKEEPMDFRLSASRRFISSPGSDDESDDEQPLPAPSFTHRLKGKPTIHKPKKAEKLKSSGLSRVFHDMDVDRSPCSSSTYQSSPVAGPSSRPHQVARGYNGHPMMLRSKPSRSGLARGDVFSPHRSSPDGGHGSIDYSSSPMAGVLDDEEDDEVVRRLANQRSYVFRGKKVSQNSPEF